MRLFVIYAIPTPNADLQQLEKLILEEIELLKKELVSEEEIERVKNMLNAYFIYAGVASLIHSVELNEAIAIKDWRYYMDMPKRLEKITPKMLLETAQKYLVEDQSTTGHFIPLNEAQIMKIEVNTQDQATFYTLKTSHAKALLSAYMIEVGQTHLQPEHGTYLGIFSSLIGRSTQNQSEEMVNETLESKGIMHKSAITADYIVYYFKCRSRRYWLIGFCAGRAAQTLHSKK